MRNVKRGMLLGLALLTLAVALPLVVRWTSRPAERGPAIEVVVPGSETRQVSLSQMRQLPQIVRHGEAQNQLGNWKDSGTYQGVLLTDLLLDATYTVLDVIAADGYRVSIERWRVEDGEHPMILAYACDGVAVPAWKDGFRLVVLPEDGRIGNEEYQAVSAGSYWVKNVVRLVLE